MSIKLTDISFTYPHSSRAVLDRINFDVPSGRSVALMGPSGRGKSTLLSIAGLLLRPDHGTVEIGGQRCTTADARRFMNHGLAWVLQTVSLLPRRSLLDNVALPLGARGMSRQDAEERAMVRLDKVGLSSLAMRQARSVSGGEAQRVGVARALVTEPVVLLADEPTANLDHETASLVARTLFESARNTTLIVATHDPEIASYADEIYVLDDGLTVAS